MIHTPADVVIDYPTITWRDTPAHDYSADGYDESAFCDGF